MKYLSTYSSQTPVCLSQSLAFVLDWKTFFGEDTTGFTVKSFVLYREGQDAFLIRKHIAAALQRVRDCVHIVHAGGTEQQIHSHAGDADEQNGHQRDTPL